MEPLVSIITPAYKAEKFIEECIKSVQAQTYKNWEMIIVNDCSPDNTEQIVIKHSIDDARIKLISLKENNGVVNARNIALNSSKGNYIAFLDSDDLWTSDKLKIQIEAMLKNKWAMSYTSYSLMNEDGKQLNKEIRASKSSTHKTLLRGSNMGCLTVVINKDITDDFRMPNIHHEDYATWLEILSRGHIAYGIDKNLATYRKASASLSGDKLKAASWQWNILRKHLNFGIMKSVYFFTHYAINGVRKSI